MFDGIIALEAASYAQDHHRFLHEMQRLLKRDGRLVIIDVFCTPRPLNSLMNTIYQNFCSNFGHLNPATITEYEDFFNQNGFTDVYSRDISIHVSPSVISMSLKSFLNLLQKQTTEYYSSKNTTKNKDFLHVINGTAILWGCLCGVLKVIRYYGISAKKN